ncbi:MAG: carboxymuconolactone decarboxylase family protein [Myxococcales bacterium]|nr:carboxymuconolactone decarboxylase family protein [Myxococcales bacterium]
MSRITTPASIDASPVAAQPLLVAVKKQLGSVPNLFRIIGNSPAALDGYLGLNGALGKGALDGKTRERIALAVAELNGCSYCLSAHSYLGAHVAKLDPAELNANRDGASADPKADAALRFATQLVRERGHVSAADVDAVKAAGYGDAEVVEIVAHVALNTLTNYINSALDTDVDFPKVEARAAYTGQCAVAISMGERVPSDATSVTRHDGRTFRFSSPEAKAMFDAAPATYITKADANWPRLR